MFVYEFSINESKCVIEERTLNYAYDDGMYSFSQRPFLLPKDMIGEVTDRFGDFRIYLMEDDIEKAKQLLIERYERVIAVKEFLYYQTERELKRGKKVLNAIREMK